MPKRERRLKEELKKCKETNRSLNDFFNITNHPGSDQNNETDTESPDKNTLKRKQPNSPTTSSGTPSKRHRHNSGHRVVFDPIWQNGRPWLQYIDNKMICTLCKKHSKLGAWSSSGCVTLRIDKIKEHEHCAEHLMSVNKESEEINADKCSIKLKTDSHNAIQDALKVLYYLIEHNLSLDLFSSLVDLNIELGSYNLANLQLAKNAKYTSWDIVTELLQLLSDEVRENLLKEMRKSPTYSIMVDEVMDITSHKHLAICARYIDSECNIKNAFISDPLINDGRAQTITDKIKQELVSADLPISKMSAFGSDGASVLSGKKNGVWAKLKEVNPSLIANHCKDFRLALACRDSYKSVKVVKRLDDTLDNLHKYYKYSCNHTKSLEDVQKALGDPCLKMKKAKHHRWLSHSQAVRSILTSYRSIIIDLEANTISGDPVGNGLLKNLKDPYIMCTLLLLGDVLPQMTTLSLFFQRRDVHLGMVKTMVDKTISFLNKKKQAKYDGPWMTKLNTLAEECKVDITQLHNFDTSVREPFLTELIDNIETRFADTDAMDNLAVLDTSLLAEVPGTYAITEIDDLATHFQIDNDILLNEWSSFIDIIRDKGCNERSIMACLKFLLSEKFGLSSLFPNIIHLMSTAAVLPLSTAEVERVFSQVKMVKCEHRNRLKQETLNFILHVKLNCNKQCFEHLSDNVVKKFFSMKDRKIQSYLGR